MDESAATVPFGLDGASGLQSAQLSTPSDDDELASSFQSEPEIMLPDGQERTPCKIKVRIHRLDADQSHQLQELLERWAADMGPDIDVQLSLKHHNSRKRPLSSMASSYSGRPANKHQARAASSADVLEYVMQAQESLAISTTQTDQQQFSPFRQNNLDDELYQADSADSDHTDSSSSEDEASLPRPRLTGLAYRFANTTSLS